VVNKEIKRFPNIVSSMRRRIGRGAINKIAKFFCSAALLLMVEGHISALPRNLKISETPRGIRGGKRSKRDNIPQILKTGKRLIEMQKKSRTILLNPKSNRSECARALKNLSLTAHNWKNWKINSKGRERILKKIISLMNDPDRNTRFVATSTLKTFDWSNISKKLRREVIINILTNLKKDSVYAFGDSSKVLSRMGEWEASLVFNELKKSKSQDREALIGALGAFNWQGISGKLNTKIAEEVLLKISARQMLYKSGQYKGIVSWSDIKEDVYLLSQLDWSKIPKRVSKKVDNVLSPIFNKYSIGVPLWNYKGNRTRDHFANLLIRIGEPGAKGIILLLRNSRVPGVFYPMLNALSKADPKELKLGSKSIYNIIQAVGPYLRYKHPEINMKEIRRKADKVIKMLNKLKRQKSK
jgi:hypothetical protein